MKNKKYLDKVVNHLVRSTKIDYGNNKIYYTFSTFSHSLPFRTRLLPNFFYYYCKDQFGLTDVEIRYVWNEYREIIKDKK